jgi:hypothetical protein
MSAPLNPAPCSPEAVEENKRMAGSAAIETFLGFCARRNPRLIHPVPQHTPYELMLLDLARGDRAVRAAFDWAKSAQQASDEAVLADWKRQAAGERAAIRRVVPLRHRLAPPPREAAWHGLEAQLDGASGALLELYRRHDGAELFVDAGDGGSGLFCYPIAEMAAEHEALAERLDGPTMEILEDGNLQVFGRPDWLDGALVFAGFGYAPERLLLPTRGEHRGSVFLFSHDPLRLLRLHHTFDGLLDELGRNPIALLGAYGGPAYQGAERYESSAD